MSESLPEMLARHQQEIMALVDEMNEEAHGNGMKAWYAERCLAPSDKALKAIVEKVAKEAGTTAPLILSSQHHKDKVLSKARRKCWSLARKKKFSYEAIGKFFNRHHTSIASGIREYEKNGKVG